MARKDIKQISANSGHLGEVASPQSTDAVGVWRGVAGAMLVGWTTAANFLTRTQASQSQAELGSDNVTDMSPLRVRQAMNAWIRGTRTVTGAYPIIAGIDPATSDFGKAIRANPAGGQVTITFPDASAVAVPHGLFCTISGQSGENPIAITVAVAGQLRSQPSYMGSWNASANTVYLGVSTAKADEALVWVFRFGSVWLVSGFVRAASGDDRSLATAADL